MSVKIITPEELRYILEVELNYNERKLIKSLAKTQNMTLYDKNNCGIYLNFRKFCYLLTKMYNESVDEYLSQSLAVSIFKEHNVYIIKALYEYCEEDNNEFYAEVGKMFFEANIEEDTTCIILSFVIDKIMAYADSLLKEQYDEYYNWEITAWI